MTLAPRAVLFDMDGVLVFTEMIKAEAHVAAVEWLGGTASVDLYIRMLGQSHESIRAAYMRAAGLTASPEEYTRHYRKIYHELLDAKMKVRPGAKELIEKLHAMGFRLVVVSSSSRASISKILRSIGLEDAFQVQVTSDDVRERKPDPAPYRYALKHLGIPAQDALVFEDSPSGVESAIRAGIRAIAVRHDFNREQPFEGAAAILESFEDTDGIAAMVQSIFARKE